MKDIFKQNTLSSGGILVIALMAANFLNFAFNAILGRVLNFEEFGFLTLISTLTYLIGIFLAGLSATVNYRVSYLQAEHPGRIVYFYNKVMKNGLVVGIFFTITWIAISWPLTQFFNVADSYLLTMVSPVILFGILNSVGKGFLQGNLQFRVVAVLVMVEAVSKLLIALILMTLNQSYWVFLSIPVSTIIAFGVLTVILMRNKNSNYVNSDKITEVFPKAFFGASILAGLSTYAFMTFDVLLAKHFLDPVVAGQYAVLSLVGKMVFFFGSLLNSFIITFVARAEGEKKNSIIIFYKIFAGTAFFTLTAFILLGPLGFIFVPLLLGAKATAVVPYLTLYTLAIALFTLTNTVVAYHLAKKHYVFPVLSVIISLGMVLSIWVFHADINQITMIVLSSAFVSFIIITLLHFLYDQGRFILRNTIDLIDLFNTLPSTEKPAANKKRILVFNWRDTKHKFAGGAEVYVHELAKRWVRYGHLVTLFCGNDSMCPRYEVIDGVYVIRRGGFYMVYVWAFLYYLKHFRGKYNVIIDCQNGIPFFSPLYSKEKVLCLVFHVHQKVFQKYLSQPMAILAQNLEKRLMPYTYKNSKYITISESTKTDMMNLGLLDEEIEIIYPGVDLENLKAGKKSIDPLIVYLGRLKAYKSVDILLQAFKIVLEKSNKSRLVIAGSGEEEKELKRIAKELGVYEKVQFTGYISEKEKVSLLQKAWVVVNPSYMEGWGITSIEANACGTPVVASDVPGLRESIDSPNTGLLTPYGEPKAFALNILKLIENPHLRTKMQNFSLDWAKNFDWDQSAKKSLELLLFK